MPILETDTFKFKSHRRRGRVINIGFDIFYPASSLICKSIKYS